MSQSKWQWNTTTTTKKIEKSLKLEIIIDEHHANCQSIPFLCLCLQRNNERTVSVPSGNLPNNINDVFNSTALINIEKKYNNIVHSKSTTNHEHRIVNWNNSCAVPCARIFNHEIIALVLEYDPDRTPIQNKNTTKYECWTPCSITHSIIRLMSIKYQIWTKSCHKSENCNTAIRLLCAFLHSNRCASTESIKKIYVNQTQSAV